MLTRALDKIFQAASWEHMIDAHLHQKLSPSIVTTAFRYLFDTSEFKKRETYVRYYVFAIVQKSENDVLRLYINEIDRGQTPHSVKDTLPSHVMECCLCPTDIKIELSPWEPPNCLVTAKFTPNPPEGLNSLRVGGKVEQLNKTI